MLARVAAATPANALDIGCGEGRFCRLMQAQGIATTGIDPVAALIDEARRRDPGGDYRLGTGEAPGAPDNSFDLVVSYLSLIDIPDIATAIPAMARALRRGGRLLIANLNGFNTAGLDLGWDTGGPGFVLDHYLEERAVWTAWRGIRVLNHHRPLATYMALLLDAGLVLTHFAEPPATGGPPDRIVRYNRAPWFLIMEWQKPAIAG